MGLYNYCIYAHIQCDMLVCSVSMTFHNTPISVSACRFIMKNVSLSLKTRIEPVFYLCSHTYSPPPNIIQWLRFTKKGKKGKPHPQTPHGVCRFCVSPQLLQLLRKLLEHCFPLKLRKCFAHCKI